eukprot:3547414-Ditylum_brightwellii.AAC.1
MKKKKLHHYIIELDGVDMVDSSGGKKKCVQKQRYTLANEITLTKTHCVEEKNVVDAAGSLLSLVHTRHLSAA